MIELAFRIDNPRTRHDFKNLKCWYGQLTNTTAWEIEILRNSDTLFKINMGIKWRGRDHAGIHIGLGLFGYSIYAKTYDTRHRNYKTDTWEE